MEETAVDPDAVARYLGRYREEESGDEVEILIDGRYLAINTESDQLLHFWEVPGQNAWLIRESGVIIATFEEEDGEIVSITRRAGQSARTFLRLE